ncbi:hypothetical protein Ae201684_007520 [Aphanomyces euteiches]|uniref:3-beta hydroxysteroid dehydrogenase/isomerase domain-containing protein n=1 Tax=Aphanomyces euteiches TaxID=100861 RepID=A0A6G0X901_9STRA|nr:hypothetical protein Ae201684_007520 [Aphanomyces euteiches]
MLLERGYRVHTTVRDPTNAKKVAHLKALEGVSDRLTIFQAELLEVHDLFERHNDTTVGGIVFSSDSRLLGGSPHSVTVRGTLNVLTSALLTSSVRRVVLTSSTAAVGGHCGTKPPGHVFTEADWSNLELMETNRMWYSVSKTLAERAAWEFMDSLADSPFDLVTICPAWVHGPMLQPALNESCERIYDYLVGNVKEIERTERTVVVVRDVALAHIATFENPQASGRYLLVASSPTEEEIAAAVRAVCPDAPVATKLARGNGIARRHCSSMKAVKDLGLHFVSLQEMIRETCEGLARHGFVQELILNFEVQCVFRFVGVWG